MSFIFFQLVKHLFDFELLHFSVIIIVSLNSLFFLPHQNITVKSGKSAIQVRIEAEINAHFLLHFYSVFYNISGLWNWRTELVQNVFKMLNILVH